MPGYTNPVTCAHPPASPMCRVSEPLQQFQYSLGSRALHLQRSEIVACRRATTAAHASQRVCRTCMLHALATRRMLSRPARCPPPTLDPFPTACTASDMLCSGTTVGSPLSHRRRHFTPHSRPVHPIGCRAHRAAPRRTAGAVYIYASKGRQWVSAARLHPAVPYERDRCP